MGKKGGIGYGSNKKPPPTSGLVHQRPVALRQQAGRPGGGSGASQTLNPSALAAALRAEHVLQIATWASANAPPLGALLGARLGDLCEAAGAPVPDTPHSICERCESVMQVGVNCSVRVTKKKRKGKSRKTETVCNYMTYICCFCKHGNARPGTSKNHLKTKISQVAARASLEMLGKSSATGIRSVDMKTSAVNPGKIQQQGSKSVQVGVEKGLLDVTEKNHPLAGGSEQEGPKAAMGTALDVVEQEVASSVAMALDVVEHEVASSVAMALDKVGMTLEKRVEQGGTEAVEMSLDRGEQEGAVAVDMTLDRGAMVLMQNNQQGSDENEDAKAVETILETGSLDLTVKSQQEFTDQGSLEAVETTLDKVPLDLVENSHGKQESGEQPDPRVVETTLNKKPLGLTEKSQQASAEQEGLRDAETARSVGPTEVAQQQGSAEQQEGPKSVEISLPRKTLDTAKKKKKKKNQQGSAEQQEGPRLSLVKGSVVESTDSTKKRKRKGWSTLKELAGIPQ